MSDGNAYRIAYWYTASPSRPANGTSSAGQDADPTIPAALASPTTLASIRDSIVSELRTCKSDASATFNSPGIVDGYVIGIDAAIEIVMTRLKH